MLPTFSTLGSGPTVLMLHGMHGGHRMFAPQVESFAAAGYRAVAWDMPGFGHSAPIEPYTFKGLAHSCMGLIEALQQARQARPVVLLGHGIGGMVAQEVVARRPDLVRALVLCATSPAFGPAEGPWQRAFVAQRSALADASPGMDALAERLLPGLVGPAALPEGVALARSCLAEVHPATWRRVLHALPAFDRRAALARIGVPTLLLAGEYDTLAPPALVQKMAARIPASTCVVLRGVGHLLALEAPDDFDGAVLGFLALPAVLR